MALTPTSPAFVVSMQDAFASGWRAVQGLFTHEEFSPEEVLSATPGIDPRFLARVPMSSASIDVSTLNHLGQMGLRRGKEITAATHPELYAAWAQMSHRAGMKPPQLILAESNQVNAITISPEEVAVTTGLLRLMDMRETVAVLGHELGHGSSDHTKPRVLAMAAFGGAGAIIGNNVAHRGGIGSYIRQDVANPSVLRKSMKWLFGSGEKSASLLSSVLYVVAGVTVGHMVTNLVAVRPTELDADRKGALISGDPAGLISAFIKLNNNDDRSTFKKLMGPLRSGHPMHVTRIEKLREFMASTPMLEPVVAGLPPAPGAAVRADTVDAPGMQVQAIAGTERLSAEPHQVQAAAL